MFYSTLVSPRRDKKLIFQIGLGEGKIKKDKSFYVEAQRDFQYWVIGVSWYDNVEGF